MRLIKVTGVGVQLKMLYFLSFPADVTNLTMKYYFLAKLLLGHKLETLFESFF